MIRFHLKGVTTIQPSFPVDSADLCSLIRATLDDDKAEDITFIDISQKCSFADYMVVASGRSQRHVGSMANKLQDKLRTFGIGTLSVEGMENCEWVLLDAGDVVVHLFKPEAREFYNLERMWSIPAATEDAAPKTARKTTRSAKQKQPA